MIKKIAYLFLAVRIVCPSLTVDASVEENSSSEGRSLYQSAYQVIERAEKAMEAPFQSSFDPQLCLEQAKAIRSYLKKNRATDSSKLFQLLEEESTLLDMAMDYFKTIGMARPSLNALALSQKQYKAAKMKEDFKAARRALAKHFQEFFQKTP